jgi:hypothetical protein
MFTLLSLLRTSAIALGASAAGVGMYAAYEAAAKADGGYLCIAAPVVALAAALLPTFFDRAIHDRQLVRALALFLVWLPCAATVFYTAVERNHSARAGVEAQHASLHQVVERASAELESAKADKLASTAAANRVRGLEGNKCKTVCLSAKASEKAAAERLDDAEKALTAAQAKAVTESQIKQPDWLLPLALDIAGMMLIGAGFGLGRAPVPERVEQPIITVTPRQAAARRGVKTREKNRRLRAAARKNGPKLVQAN